MYPPIVVFVFAFLKITKKRGNILGSSAYLPHLNDFLCKFNAWMELLVIVQNTDAVSIHVHDRNFPLSPK